MLLFLKNERTLLACNKLTFEEEEVSSSPSGDKKEVIVSVVFQTNENKHLFVVFYKQRFNDVFSDLLDNGYAYIEPVFGDRYYWVDK